MRRQEAAYEIRDHSSYVAVVSEVRGVSHTEGVLSHRLASSISFTAHPQR